MRFKFVREIIIEVDKANEHIGYFTVFGQTDEYYID